MAKTGYKITVYLDDNPLSPTYMQTYEERTLDEETCPIETDDLVLVSNECEIDLSGYTGYRLEIYYNRTTGEYTENRVEDPECIESSDEEEWVASGDPYCETTDKGVNTGYMLQLQVQMNPELANYGEKRYQRWKSPECGSNDCPIWDEVSRQCHIEVTDCVATFDGTSDIVQIDINPLSTTYNQTRTANKEDSDCENCTESVFSWVLVGDMCGDDSLLCSNGIQQTSTNSYTVSQKYKTIGNGTPIPMDEYQVVLKTEDDEDCGYIRPQYRWDVVPGQYLCDYETYTKYEMLVKMVSYDAGETWATKQPLETQRGEVLAYDSYDCGKPLYRWAETDDFVCVDNGDDWKMKIVRSNNDDYVVPCNESPVLNQDDLVNIGYFTDATLIDFGDCINDVNCRIQDYEGSYSARALVHFGDYIEYIGDGSHTLVHRFTLINKDTFGKSVKHIRNYAFNDDLIEYSGGTLYLGSAVETIGEKAFYQCGNLNTVVIDTVIPPTIGANVFLDDDRSYYPDSTVDSIFVPSDTVAAYKEAWTAYSQYIFSLAEENTFYRATYSGGTRGWNFSSEGTNGVLTKRMTKASYKGNPVSSITDVYLSNNITIIDRGAFYEFTSLSGLSIPSSVQYIYSDAFYGCAGKTEDNLNYLDTYLIGFADKTVGSYTVKNGTKYIGKWVWSTNSLVKETNDVTSFTIPNSVEYIGSLPTIYYDSNNNATNTTWWNNFLNSPSNWQNGVAYLNNYAVASESGITELNLRSGTVGVGYAVFKSVEFTTIELPSTLKYIDNAAFEFCHGLDGVALPESLLVIGPYSFCGTDQTSVTIPRNVREIGASAFWMTPLTSITINCEYVSQSAFETNNDVLTTIILGENVKELDSYAFSNRRNSLNVYSYATKPPILGEKSISTVKGHKVYVYVPSDLVNTYKSAPYWSGFTINAI